MLEQVCEFLTDVRLEALVDDDLDSDHIIGPDLDLRPGVLGGAGRRDLHHLSEGLIFARCAHGLPGHGHCDIRHGVSLIAPAADRRTR